MPCSRRSIVFGVSLGLLAATLAGACGNSGIGFDPRMQQAPAGLIESGRIYRLGIGDKLKVQVFGEPDLSGAFEVGASGNVGMPLVGEIPAQGRPVAEFREAVARKLAEGYLKSPKVTVEITNYRPIYVHGEVRTGGEFQFKSGLKVRDAIALAGGYTYRANQSYIMLTRPGVALNARVANTGDLEILPGDNIQIPERFF